MISLPGFLEYDTRDNATDARKGVLGRLAVTPYSETFGEGGYFIKTLATGQTYFSSSDIKYKPTFAMRFSVGSIAGQTGENIPSDIRFYGGGSGSVRGYGYKNLGPRLNGQPIGGSSIIESSLELRLRFTETIGGAVFLDAGNSFAEQIPQFGGKLYYGAGAGVRYYSPLGPLRLDVAVPVNGDDIDQKGYQLYVSIGQAF